MPMSMSKASIQACLPAEYLTSQASGTQAEQAMQAIHKTFIFFIYYSIEELTGFVGGPEREGYCVLRAKTHRLDL